MYFCPHGCCAETSGAHQEAIYIEMALADKANQRLIQPNENPVTSSEKKAFVGYLKCMYWCTKEEIAHSTKIPSVLKLAKSLGCEYLDDIKFGRNIHYISQNCTQDTVGSLGQTVLQLLLQGIHQSDLYSILIDETTDVSIKKQLIMYCPFFRQNAAPSSLRSIAMNLIPSSLLCCLYQMGKQKPSPMLFLRRPETT